MARAIDGDELLGIERLLDTDIVRQSKTASWLLDQVLHDIQAMPTLTPPNEPLTLEELRKMDGEPVYMTFPSDTGNQCGHWALVGTQRWGAVSLIYGCGWSSYESAVETLGAKFYRRPPEGEEHCYG